LFVFFHAACPKEHFPKEKTEKKKAATQCGKSGKPKGNGITGGDPSGEKSVYAVVFWFATRLCPQ